MRFIALLAVALHVWTVEGHVHIPQFPPAQAAFAAHHSAQSPAPQSAPQRAQPALSNATDPSPCIFCQAMASAGPGLAPNAPLLILFGAAALVAALFGQRQITLQRLTIWRSRAPPHRL